MPAKKKAKKKTAKKKAERQEVKKDNPRCANPKGCNRIAYWKVLVHGKDKGFASCTLHMGYLTREAMKAHKTDKAEVEKL